MACICHLLPTVVEIKLVEGKNEKTPVLVLLMCNCHLLSGEGARSRQSVLVKLKKRMI